MVTNIPQIQVNRVEAGGGFTATCTSCGWRIIRPHREGADQAAAAHQASHAHPDPADHVDDLTIRDWARA